MDLNKPFVEDYQQLMNDRTIFSIACPPQEEKKDVLHIEDSYSNVFTMASQQPQSIMGSNLHSKQYQPSRLYDIDDSMSIQSES